MPESCRVDMIRRAKGMPDSGSRHLSSRSVQAGGGPAVGRARHCDFRLVQRGPFVRVTATTLGKGTSGGTISASYARYAERMKGSPHALADRDEVVSLRR